MTIVARLVTLALALGTPLCVEAQSVSTTTGAINGAVTDSTKAGVAWLT